MSEAEEIRRPRPIGVADESDEDSDTGAGAGDKPAPDTTGVAAPEEVTVKKPSKKMPAFSENDLVKDKGLRQVYRDFPQKCRYKGKGREAEFLRGLMVAYKEWGYQLYPGVAFEDLASRIEKLGGKARTRDLMHELRDTERDRVIEAKYGRAAVDDIRAQEAAKFAAKESKTAAAQDEEAEESEDEELAGDRYAMEADGERVGGGGDKDGGNESQAAAEGATAPASTSAAVMSEQVRQRIEVNRRLALDRLRLKKEEAAAVPGGENNQGIIGAAAVAAVDDTGSGEVMDLMDVDGRGPEAAGDDLRDEEAALADMEAEGMTAWSTVAATQGRTTAEPSSAISSASPASTSALRSEGTPAVSRSVAEEMASPEPTIREDEAMEGVVESGASGIAAAVADDIAPAPVSGVIANGAAKGAVGDVVARTGPADGVGDAAAKYAAGATRGGSDSDEPGTYTGEDIGGVLSPASESGEPSLNESGRAGKRSADNEGASLRADVQPTAVDASAGSARMDDAAAGGHDGAAEAVVMKDDRQASFSSPAKGKAAASGLPLSPLGNLFASTDVSAEGGLAAVRAPLGGLFSDENA